jgi:hypothetical protein
MTAATGEFVREKVKDMTEFNSKEIVVYFCVFKLHLSGYCFTQTGLVLGVYSTDDDAERFKLTSAANKLNEKTNGALLEHIKL